MMGTAERRNSAEAGGGERADDRIAHSSRQALKPLSLNEPLAELASAAVHHALSCLAGLSQRFDDTEYDRGARSAESLMRVAKAAAALRSDLRADLQREALEHENSDQGDGVGRQSRDGMGEENDLKRQAEQLAEYVARELDKLNAPKRPPETVGQSEDNDLHGNPAVGSGEAAPARLSGGDQ